MKETDNIDNIGRVNIEDEEDIIPVDESVNKQANKDNIINTNTDPKKEPEKKPEEIIADGNKPEVKKAPVIRAKRKKKAPAAKKNNQADIFLPGGLPTLSQEDSVRRAKAIYNGLTTMEAKFEFLIEYGAFLSAKEEMGEPFEDELMAKEDLKQEFMDQYVANADLNTVKNITKLFGKYTTKYSAEMNRERKENLLLIPENEEKRAKKAYYLTRQSSKAHSYGSSVDDIFGTFSQTIGNSNAFRNALYNDAKITADTTVLDLAKYLGYDDPAFVDDFCRSVRLKREDKVLEGYTKNLTKDGKKPSEAIVKISISVDLCNALGPSYKKMGQVEYASENKIPEQELNEIKELNVNNAGDIPKNGIEEWIKSTGDKIVDEKRKASNLSIKNEFEDKFIRPYEIENNGFEVIEKPFKIKGPVTLATVSNLGQLLLTFVPFFGNYKNEINDKIVAAVSKYQGYNEERGQGKSKDEKSRIYEQPFEDEFVSDISKDIKEYIDLIDKVIEEDDSPLDSYVSRTRKIVKKNIDLQTSGDIAFLDSLNLDGAYKLYAIGGLNNFPRPIFTYKDKDNNVISSGEDLEKFQEVMSKVPMVESVENVFDYIENVQLPYYKKKINGNTDEKDAKDFNKATYEHLLKEKEYLNKIINHDPNSGIMDMVPFCNQKMAMEDWTGNRFGSTRAGMVDADISALKRGFSAEDIPLIEAAYVCMTELEKQPGGLSIKEFTKVSDAYNKFKEAYIDSKEDRAKILKEVKPVFTLFRKAFPTIKPEFDRIYENAVKNSPFIGHVNAEDRARLKYTKMLEKISKGLYAQHRGSLIAHEDTDEMKALKNKVEETLRELKANREESIYSSRKFETLFGEIATLSNNYIELKKEEFVEETNQKKEASINKKTEEITAKINGLAAKYPDDLDRQTKERDRLEKQLNDYKNKLSADAEKKINDWTPGSKMGQTRFESAKDLKKVFGSYEIEIKGKITNFADHSEVIKEMKELGFDIKHVDDIEYATRRPYETGLSYILNYYGTNPAFIPEHYGVHGKLYNKEEFLNVFKKIDVEGVTSDEFAAITYATVLDPANVKEEDVYKIWSLTKGVNQKEDILRNANTMYTLDLAVPRAGATREMLPYTLVPAKEKALDAIEAYQDGDMTKLVDILTNGIKGANVQCTTVKNIGRGSGKNFAYASDMLYKMVDFARKDKKLFKAVKDKIGKNAWEDIKDTIRLKSYLDDCLDAEAKLKKAALTGKPLDERVKKDCINKIIRYDFVAAIHDDLRDAQVENDPEVKAFESTLVEKLMNLDKYGVNQNDLSTTRDIYRTKASKPIYQVTKRLRTEEGRTALAKQVLKFAAKINLNQPEEGVLKSLSEFKKNIELKDNRVRIESQKKLGDEKKTDANKVKKEEIKKK